MASERELTWAKARRMSPDALRVEIARCRNGIITGATGPAKRRFELRLRIMEQELAERSPAPTHSTKPSRR